MAGYSGTPLEKKLGLKDGQRVCWLNRPATLDALASSRAFLRVEDRLDTGPFDVIHLFTDSRTWLEQTLPRALAALDGDGMIWVSWPKKASKVPTDVTEDMIRALALSTTLVDVKVCAVDNIWSGLKLVIRKEHRHTHRR